MIYMSIITNCLVYLVVIVLRSLLFCCCRSGTRANAPVALQPLGLLYYPVPPSFRRSHCRRQMPPRSSLRERSKKRIVELYGWEKYPITLPKCRLPRTFRDVRHGTDGFTSRPKEGVLRIFSPLKIRRLRPCLNPRTWVLKASTLPLDHRSRMFPIY
jgi:hypothetical protein